MTTFSKCRAYARIGRLFLLILTMAGIVSFIVSLWRRQPTLRTNKHNLALPRVSHLELGVDVIRDRKVFVIGDVHGCYDELVELVKKAKQRERNTLFIFVGDLINKGSQSVQVLNFVQSLDCYSVRGNHDEAVLNQYYCTISDPSYTLPSRYDYIKDLKTEDFDYLKNLPFTISIPSMKALIVHAGLIPGLPLSGQDLMFLTHMRNIEEQFPVFHGTYPTLVPSESAKVGVPWASLWSGPEHVYFGHDAVRGFQTYPYATGLDTGCVYGKKLTGIFLNTKEIISVKSTQNCLLRTCDDAITEIETGVTDVMSSSDQTPRIEKYDLPLPPIPHLVLGETTVRGKAVFVVGDVHGCLDELKVLIKMAQEFEPKIIFVFVGDLVNKGPYSNEVLEFVRSGAIECYTVRGNHEEIAMKEYNLLRTEPLHMQRAKAKRAWIQDMTSENYEFLTRLPFTIRIPSLNAIVVHAGLIPGVSIETQSLRSLTRIRNVIQKEGFEQERELTFSSKVREGVPWSTLWHGPEHVYYGHDARRGLQQREFATCLDTGCQYGFRLTGLFINGCKKILSVEAQKVYYVGKPTI